MLLKMVLRNLLRHRLRSLLTVIGVAIAILAFGLLRTLVGLWQLGAEQSSATRLVTRNAVSLVFPLPYAYYERLRQIPGVTEVSLGNWFGGIYIDEKNFFGSYAVEPRSYLKLVTELAVDPREQEAFVRDRKGCLVGGKLAARYGWKIGDLITLRGTIYPGDWEFVLRATYRGKDKSVDERGFLFHWDYLNERIKQSAPRRADQVGFYMVGIARPELAPAVSHAIDTLFRNSLAETLTETEKAFHQSFIAMTDAIMIAIELVSYVVIVIIMVVAANTMAMTARERTGEYATLKTLGFGGRHIAVLVCGESLALALLGGGLGVALTFPAGAWIETELGQFFPIFTISGTTVVMQLAAAAAVGAVAALFPTWHGARVGIADGLRRVG